MLNRLVGNLYGISDEEFVEVENTLMILKEGFTGEETIPEDE